MREDRRYDVNISATLSLARDRRRIVAAASLRWLHDPRRQRRTTRCCWSPSAARRSPTTWCRSSRTSPAAAASRASGSRRSASTTSLFGGRSPINDQNRAFLAALREDLAGAGIDLPVYWGNRNWDPYLDRHARADGGRRRHPGRLLRDQRLLVVLVAAGSTARTSSTRSAGRSTGAPGSTSCGTTSTTPASSSRSSTRRWPRSPSCPTTSATRAHLVFVTHSIPTTMADGSGPDGGAYVAQHLNVAAEVVDAGAPRRPAAGTPHELVYCSRSGAAAGPVAGARRQRPPRGAARRTASRRW